MLRYLGLGKRYYGERPMPAHKRVNWEFLAVIQGKITPFEREELPRSPVSNTLWLFPPGVVHGWGGEIGKSCTLVVVHFSTVPKVLERLASQRGFLQTKLSPNDKVILRDLANKLKRHYWKPIMESEIHTERALMDLSLLVLRDYKEGRQRQSAGGSYGKVVAAEEWLRTHLADNPSISDAARIVGLSVSQLNRLFCRIRSESPQRVLNRLKIVRAMELLGSSNAKLNSIATECGFSTASNLCRAFKATRGHSPKIWRRETFIQHKPVSESAKGDYTKHGRRLRPES